MAHPKSSFWVVASVGRSSENWAKLI
jgi:hypothetical protein